MNILFGEVKNLKDKAITIYTIGHSNHELYDFIDLLKKNRINSLYDVRSSPYSKFVPHFNKAVFAPKLMAAGIKYRFAGRELGGMPSAEEFYDDKGYVLYSKLAVSMPFRDGITMLEADAAKNRIAIMCGEEVPDECHRRLLVGRVLFEKGIEVIHILKDGNTIGEHELRERENKEKFGNQMSLFGDMEIKEWKSTQSVSPKNRPRNFSED